MSQTPVVGVVGVVGVIGVIGVVGVVGVVGVGCWMLVVGRCGCGCGCGCSRQFMTCVHVHSTCAQAKLATN